MIATPDIALALRSDARAIALLSRNEIEQGLEWAWTERRVRRAIADPSTNVVIARHSRVVAGFALMRYEDDEAHLLLLGVNPQHRRQGIGRALMRWLEDTLLVAGIEVVHAEVRVTRSVARAFYASLGYRETRVIPGYYQGTESAVRIVKQLVPGGAEEGYGPGAFGQ